MELQKAIGLEVKGFAVVGREQDEGLIDGVGVASVAEREVWQVVGMDLRFVGTCSSRYQPISPLCFCVSVGARSIPVLTTHSPSSLTLTHWLAS